MSQGAGAARAFARTLRQSLSLSAWLRPASRPQLLGFGAFIASCIVALLVFAVHDFVQTPGPSRFFGDGLHYHASYFILVLVAAWVCAQLLWRPALWLALASMAVLMGAVWTSLSVGVRYWLGDAGDWQAGAWHVLLAMAGFAALFRLVGYLAEGTPASRRLGATLVFVALLSWPWYWHQEAWLWYPPETEAAADAAQAAAAAVAVAQAARASDNAVAPAADKDSATFDAESVIYAQPHMLRQMLSGLRAQTPERIDLFTIGFAGDGSERVFRNEVEYFDRLMSQRFGADSRNVSLVNASATVRRFPLATLSNLRSAAAGVASRMDPVEDVLVLFLTSHGSEDHRLIVDMEPLPLNQIRPRDVRAALDDAGIQWRVIIVSACFSGGFVDALRDQRTLVITAARADRPSFGCGNDSTITWFGKAFLSQALNQTLDFERAFELASKQVREWELAEGETPSVPQMAGGWEIRQHLAAWRKTADASAPSVQFQPRQPPPPSRTPPTPAPLP